MAPLTKEEAFPSGSLESQIKNFTDVVTNQINSTDSSEEFSITSLGQKTISQLLTTLLTPSPPVNNTAAPSLISEYDEDLDMFIPTLNADSDKYHILEHFLNNSKIISDDAENTAGFFNTPLTAPELTLVNVPTDSNFTYYGGLLGSPHVEELGWLIPVVVAVIFIFFLIAYACFYGLQALEVKMMMCCFRTFGCCRPGSRTRAGDETDALTTSMVQNATEMKAYQSHRSLKSSDNFDL